MAAKNVFKVIQYKQAIIMNVKSVNQLKELLVNKPKTFNVLNVILIKREFKNVLPLLIQDQKMDAQVIMVKKQSIAYNAKMSSIWFLKKSKRVKKLNAFYVKMDTLYRKENVLRNQMAAYN